MLGKNIKRTTITVPQGLVDHLKTLTRAPSKTKAVMAAIHGEIKRQKLARFRSLAGKIRFHPSPLTPRHHDHRLR